VACALGGGTAEGGHQQGEVDAEFLGGFDAAAGGGVAQAGFGARELFGCERPQFWHISSLVLRGSRGAGWVAFRSQPMDAAAGAEAEKQGRLTGVVLGVAQGVEQELADVELVPREAAAFDALSGQAIEGVVAFMQAVIGVGE